MGRKHQLEETVMEDVQSELPKRERASEDAAASGDNLRRVYVGWRLAAFHTERAHDAAKLGDSRRAANACATAGQAGS
jgi:hypothetical protein